MFSLREEYKSQNKKKIIVLSLMMALVILFFFISLFTGTGNLTLKDVFLGLFGKSSNINNAIMRKIRLPRVISALICGTALGASGLIMQTTLGNKMASPSTLGVSNAAVLGANIAIIIFSEGVVSTQNGTVFNSTYSTTIIAFIFSLIAIGLILILSKIKNFSRETIILIGIALGALFQALTNIIQYFSVDVKLQAAVYWTFGDLSRTNMKQNYFLIGIVIVSIAVFILFTHSYNGLELGDESAKSLGINTSNVRMISLFVASLLTASVISFYGIIGFLGIMGPHTARRFVGQNHKYLLPASILSSTIILLISDLIARVAFNGIALPVGAVTSIIGAPFFLYLVFSRKEVKDYA